MNEKLPWYKRLVNFLRDVRSELKRVTWPSKQEVYGTTVIVIITVFFFGFYLFFVDVLFSWIIAQIKLLIG
ncbi:MAG: preprotein translocase subunit SecE [Candidatus Saccharicenans sp.]|nr:preprotein translocase subunit SecE [Candidatus Saccharicenans sp.]